MKPLRGQIEAITTDREQGASQLARRALQVLREALGSSQARSAAGLTREMEEIAGLLSACRPAMGAIRSGVKRFQEMISQYDPSQHTVDELGRLYAEVLERLEAEMEQSRLESIANAADFLGSKAVIVTCSYSSTVIAALVQAGAQGKDLRLTILRSQSGTGSYGVRTAEHLNCPGIRWCLVDDDQLSSALYGADMVLLGTDTVFADGSIVNGSPSLELAQEAKKHEPPVPVYVIADRSKYSADRTACPAETGFELLAADLIQGLITEFGLVDPEGIGQLYGPGSKC